MQKAYALFDFDGTLISGDSIWRFCWYAYRKGLCSFASLRQGIWAGIQYGLKKTTAETSKQAAMAFIEGHSRVALQEFSRDFCETVLRRRLRKKGLAELKARKEEGAEILLVTASPAFYLEPLKEMLGIVEIIGTRMDFDSAGKATGLIGENCKGLQKPLRLAEYLAATGGRLDYESSYAYGDTAGDMPMLELCGHKVGVCAKPKLKGLLRGAEGAILVRW